MYVFRHAYNFCLGISLAALLTPERQGSRSFQHRHYSRINTAGLATVEAKEFQNILFEGIDPSAGFHLIPEI
jgi:hypothetical protein